MLLVVKVRSSFNSERWTDMLRSMVNPDIATLAIVVKFNLRMIDDLKTDTFTNRPVRDSAQ